ncbi:ADP-ribosylation/Crystallin J1 [Mycena metata]|uniref:ADP-ribosylation/Crystallin J1 n=1 Tax=Mycena metata TaxID=1033252 RepID=A0AAD7ITG3_9AGAR|nr:ADP-ribosylation/Crystallin J1 [Mycena metata]
MPLTSPLPLHLHPLPPAPPSTKIRLALLGTALADALGGPAEFHERFSFDFLSEMRPNETFRLPKGVWTDDTSGALALGRAIAGASLSGSGGRKDKEEGEEEEGREDAAQLDAYYRWWQDGVLSATGECFDIGGTTHAALGVYHQQLRVLGVLSAPPTSTATNVVKQLDDKTKRRQAAALALPRIARDLRGAVFGGNGSLMRVLPVGLAHWGAGPDVVGAKARRSSKVTHPNEVCVEACAVWAMAVASVVRAAAAGAKAGAGTGTMTKLDVLHHFAGFAYETGVLRGALAAEVALPAEAVGDPQAMEAHYVVHHPILRLVAQTVASSPSSPSSPTPSLDDTDLETRILALLPMAATLPSSGYVVHTIVAALYAFLATSTFEHGALLTANMGDDADTVGAVYGGLAGVWYAVDEPEGAATATQAGGGAGQEPEGGGFWSQRVRRWRDELVRRDVIEEVAGEVVGFARRWEV